MKFQFKIQPFQTEAAESIVNIFAGQPNQGMSKYRLDLGKRKGSSGQKSEQLGLFGETDDQKRKRLADKYYNTRDQLTAEETDILEAAYRNVNVELSAQQMLKNIRDVQTRNNIKYSTELSAGLGAVSLDVEMETGTGKTYCYIKTMFELNKAYGWS